MIVKVPVEILNEAVKANLRGQSYTVHIEGVFGGTIDDDDVIPAAEPTLEIPHKEIERLTAAKIISASDLQGKK